MKLTLAQQTEAIEILRNLCWASEQLQSPDIDWIRPQDEVDESILTEIELQQLLAKAFLKRIGAKVDWVPADEKS